LYIIFNDLFLNYKGTVPGPIFFGAIIDSTCVIWKEKCGKHASCWIYDNHKLSRNFFLLVVCCKIVSITFFMFAHQLYKPPPEKGVSYSVTGSVNGEITASVDISGSDT